MDEIEFSASFWAVNVNRNQKSAKITKWLKCSCGRGVKILPRLRLLDVEVKRPGEGREGDGARAVGAELARSLALTGFNLSARGLASPLRSAPG